MSILNRYNGISAILTVAEQIRRQNGDKDAMKFVIEQLGRRPSVKGLKWVIELSLEHSKGEARNNLNILDELTSKLLEGKPVYRCKQCGFSGKSLHWQCPGCKQWNSVKPIQGVEAE
jgi:lipopolysaccharide biosynthesis regulator YciM